MYMGQVQGVSIKLDFNPIYIQFHVMPLNVGCNGLREPQSILCEGWRHLSHIKPAWQSETRLGPDILITECQ